MTSFPSPNAPHQEEDRAREGTLSGKITDEILICKICFLRYSTNKNKLPKLLSCSHTFCEPCLRQHVEKLNILDENNHNIETVSKSIYVIKAGQYVPKQLICPLCRKKTDLTDGKIENLLNNFTILSLLDIIENQAESVITQPKSSSALFNVWDKNKRRSGFSKLYPSIPESHNESKDMSERCIVCNKRFPESQCKCGHCICYPCSTNSKMYYDGSNCPKCSNEILPIHRPDIANKCVSPEESCEVNRPPPFNPCFLGGNMYRSSSEILMKSNSLSENYSDYRSNEKACPVQQARSHFVHIDQHDSKKIVNSVQGSARNNEENRNEPHANFPFAVNAHISHLTRYSSQPASPSFQHSRRKHFRSLSNGVQISSEPGSCYQLNSRPFDEFQSSYAPIVPPRRHSSSSFLANRPGSARYFSPPHRVPATNHETVCSNEQIHSPAVQYGTLPPVPPQRFIQISQPSINCLTRFGKYSEVSLQTSTFRDPNKVSVSSKGDIAVTDVQQMTVQVFTKNGTYLSMFKVIGVQGVSFISNDRLAVASHRGVTIFTVSGELIKELTSGLIVNTAAYKFGFVACSPISILVYKQSFTLSKEITKRKSERMKFFRKSASLQNIKDIAVTTEKNIAILDSLKGVVFIVNESGYTIMTVNPAGEPCGTLREPESLTIDRSNNVYISDTGNKRILRFTNNGAFSKCVLNFRRTSFPEVFPRGIDITDDKLIVIISGEKAAEVHIYQIS